LDYIDWMQMRNSATLRIPLRTIFSIYGIFMAVIAIRYIWRFVVVLRKGPPEEKHEIHVGEEG
ncbi:MAG: C4-dicarboxylate ABC transporter permease, partial [Pseudomonadota bacterium]